MPTLARRSQRSTNTWPGFVDALATLLMVIIFLLMIFVLAQFFLGEAISGRDDALKKMQGQLNEITELLSLERKSGEEMRLNISQLSQELQASVIMRDDLKTSLSSMTERSTAAEEKAADLGNRLDDALATISENEKTIQADKETIATKLSELSSLNTEVATLQALRDELEKQALEYAGKIEDQGKKLDETEQELTKKNNLILAERKLSETARAQLALANQQMAALRDQLARLSATLDETERKAKEQGVQISALGKRLNTALASKVQELSRYRSEFFGRLREVLGNQPGVRVVGDRFVFQSEVLFETGSADLGDEGKVQLKQLASTLREITERIPGDIDWILRIDGHTDKVPIANWKFPSNWELSAARAISVVKFLSQEGIAANRLAAAGFGKHRPIDNSDDEIANRRNRRIEMKLTQR